MDDQDIEKYTESYENAWKTKADNTGWTLAYFKRRKDQFKERPITSMISIGHGKPKDKRECYSFFQYWGPPYFQF